GLLPGADMIKRPLIRVGVGVVLVTLALGVTVLLLDVDHSPPVLRKIKAGMSVPEVEAIIGRKCDSFGAPVEMLDDGPWTATWEFPTGRIHVQIGQGSGAEKAWWEPNAKRRTLWDRFRDWLGW